MNADRSCAICGKAYVTELDYMTDTSRWRLCNQGNLWFNCRCRSTLMIKKGKFPWYSPEKFLSEDAKSIFNSLGNLKDLPHIPAAVMELQQLLQREPDASPKTLGLALRKEPAISIGIMRIAESLRCARNPANPPIHALEHAIVYIGYKTLGDLLMTSALRAVPLPPSEFDAKAFWTEAYVRGAIAEVLMRRLKLDLSPDEVYLAASLCDVGKLVTAFCFPPLATKIANAIKDPKAPSNWRDAERSYNFPDHCILGEIAGSLWGFPTYVLEAARGHHDLPVQKRPGAGLTLIDVTAGANQLMHWVLLQPHRMEPEILKTFAERVKWTEPQVEAFANDLMPIGRQVASIDHDR